MESQVDSVHDAILGPEVQLDGEGAGRPPRQEHSDPRVRALQQGEGSLFRGMESQKKKLRKLSPIPPSFLLTEKRKDAEIDLPFYLVQKKNSGGAC